MSKNNKVFDIDLDEEEKRIEKEMERGEWTSIENKDEMIALITKSVKEKATTTITINKKDLEEIEQREGKRYKDTLGVLIHKFATGEIRI